MVVQSRSVGPARGGTTSAAAGALAARVYGGYFAAQAAVGVVLWVLWSAVPTFRSWFELLADEHAVMDAFALADGVVVVTSALSAWALWSRARWAVPMVAFTAGGIVYPTLYLVAWVALTGSGALCLAIMVPPAALSCWIARQVWRAPSC